MFKKSTKKRSLIKGIVYETSMFTLATLVIWAWSGTLKGSIIINTLLTMLKVLCYYYNERIWKKIRWERK